MSTVPCRFGILCLALCTNSVSILAVAFMDKLARCLWHNHNILFRLRPIAYLTFPEWAAWAFRAGRLGLSGLPGMGGLGFPGCPEWVWGMEGPRPVLLIILLIKGHVRVAGPPLLIIYHWVWGLGVGRGADAPPVVGKKPMEFASR